VYFHNSSTAHHVAVTGPGGTSPEMLFIKATGCGGDKVSSNELTMLALIAMNGQPPPNRLLSDLKMV